MVHNHPTGDPTPSTKDIQFTDKLYNAAKIFDIDLLDHIVIGNKSFKSVFIETKKIVDKMKKRVILLDSGRILKDYEEGTYKHESIKNTK